VGFRGPLERAVADASGAVGAAFVDGEGETIDAVGSCGRDFLRLIAAHHGVVLALLRRALDKLGTETRLTSFSVRAGDLTFSVVPVEDDTFLVLAQDRSGISAQGVEVLARAAGEVRLLI
jgi:predicted regulator of Ras-like GTPase activity (Roadblock/LC7/MglB family)